MFIFILICCFLLPSCFMQDCKTQGEICGDTKQCCGGCCISGICVETYRDCTTIENPCYESYCPPDYECFVFEPEDCEGCEWQKDCRGVEKIPEPSFSFQEFNTTNVMNGGAFLECKPLLVVALCGFVMAVSEFFV